MKIDFYLPASIWTWLFRIKAPGKCTFCGWCFKKTRGIIYVETSLLFAPPSKFLATCLPQIRGIWYVNHAKSISSYIHGPCRRFRGDQNDEDTRTFCGKFLYNAIASIIQLSIIQLLIQRNCEYNTRIVLPVASTIARAEVCLRCWRDRPFLNRTHLVFDEVIPMGRQ